MRWEYFRERPEEPDYPYALAHVHVNAVSRGGRPLDRLHIPTRRVPLEMVLWHLIAEWEVATRKPDWRAILHESTMGFDERRTAH